MGEYDTKFRRVKHYEDNLVVYPKNNKNDDIYERWYRQLEVVSAEKSKLKSIIHELK